MIKQALYSILSNDPGVLAIAGTRIYPEVIPQQVFDEVSQKPCVVYRRTAVERTSTYCETIGLARSDFDVIAFGLTYALAESLANAIRTALIDYSATSEGVLIRACNLISEFDGLDIEPGLYRVDLFFSIWHDAP